MQLQETNKIINDQENILIDKVEEIRAEREKNREKIDHLNGLIELETVKVYEIPIDNYQDEEKLIDDDQACINQGGYVYDDDCLTEEELIERGTEEGIDFII